VTGKAGNTTLVKELREKTGAGILDCQKALVEKGQKVILARPAETVKPLL
jgi:translation elongation factor EF-Ts